MVPISSPPNAFAFGSSTGPDGEDDFSLLPLTHLTPTALLGGAADDTQGRIYAVHIASLISRQSPDERRTVVVGMSAGTRGTRADMDDISDSDRNLFLDVLAMVAECKVW